MTTTPMSDTQALDEAVLYLIRKAHRAMKTDDIFNPDSAFNALWAQLPDGAKAALLAAERRADVHRDTVASPRDLVWPADEDLDKPDSADAA